MNASATKLRQDFRGAAGGLLLNGTALALSTLVKIPELQAEIILVAGCMTVTCAVIAGILGRRMKKAGVPFLDNIPK